MFGLIYYFFILFYQPVIHGVNEQNNYSKRNVVAANFIINRSEILSPKYYSIEDDLLYQYTF
jgi:hypothetical protein